MSILAKPLLSEWKPFELKSSTQRKKTDEKPKAIINAAGDHAPSFSLLIPKKAQNYPQIRGQCYRFC
jgi:hypothetical protein